MPDTLRVLITDEDPDSRVSIRRVVERAGLAVAGEVGYGAAALSFAIEAHPDIILIAVEDPIARPLDTAEALSGALPDTPLVVYSSRNEAETIRRAMILGARDYLIRPVDALRLSEAVNTIIAQEERRRRHRTGRPPEGAGRGSVITVTGAKGGVGKSVLSTNLALALRSETGKTVAIVDADTHFGDVATMLDLAPSRTVADVLPVLDQTDRDTIARFLTEHGSGVRILAAPDDVAGWSNCTPAALKRIIDLLAQTNDFVVIDTAGSFDNLVRASLEVSTLSLVLTTGEVSSIRDTAAALRRLAAWQIDDDRVKILLNHGARVNGLKTEALESALDREVFWQIPYDRRVPTSIQLGQPLVLFQQKSAVAKNISALARRLAGTRRSLVTQPHGRPFWARLLRVKGTAHDVPMATREPAPQPKRQ